jgi:hypothetical protein
MRAALELATEAHYDAVNKRVHGRIWPRARSHAAFPDFVKDQAAGIVAFLRALDGASLYSLHSLADAVEEAAHFGSTSKMPESTVDQILDHPSVRPYIDAAIQAERAASVSASTDPGGEYYTGLYCGIEDRGITDRYEAARYGWEQAFEYVQSGIPDDNTSALDDAIKAAEQRVWKEAAEVAFRAAVDAQEKGEGNVHVAMLDALKEHTKDALR